MKVRLVTFLLLTFGAAHANKMCAVVTAQMVGWDEFVKSEDPDIRAMATAEKIASILLQGQEKYQNLKPGEYRPLIISTLPEGTTLHSFHAKDKTDWGATMDDDSRVILRLPTDPSKSVWANLDAETREELAKKLTYIFMGGKYATGMVAQKRFETDLFMAMSEKEEKLIFKNSSGKEVTTGLSPVRVLRAANQDCEVGVCRTGTMALAGLLGELGIPDSDIRLVIGKEKKGEIRHIWIEIRTSPQGKWIELDPTGGQGAAARLMVGTGVLKSNRERFVDIEEHYNILTPVQIPDIKETSTEERDKFLKMIEELDRKNQKP